MIIDVLSDSLKYSFSNPKNFFKLFLLNLFDFLIIPLFFVEGYKYRIVEESLDGMIYSGDELAEMDDFKKLFIDGVKLIILKVLSIIPLILIFLLLDSFNLSNYETFVAYCFLFIYGIYLCVAIPNMIKYNSLKKAFDFKELIRILKEIGLSLIIPAMILIPIFYRAIDILGVDIVNFLFNDMHLTNFIIFSESLSGILLYIINVLLIETFLVILEYRIIGILYIDLEDE